MDFICIFKYWNRERYITVVVVVITTVSSVKKLPLSPKQTNTDLVCQLRNRTGAVQTLGAMSLPRKIQLTLKIQGNSVGESLRIK